MDKHFLRGGRNRHTRRSNAKRRRGCSLSVFETNRMTSIQSNAKNNSRRRTHRISKGKMTKGYFIGSKSKKTNRGSESTKHNRGWKKKVLFLGDGDGSADQPKDPIFVYLLPRAQHTVNKPVMPPVGPPVQLPSVLRPKTTNQSPTVITPSIPSQPAESNILPTPSNPGSPTITPEPTISPMVQPIPVPMTVQPTQTQTINQIVTRSPTRKPVVEIEPTMEPFQNPTTKSQTKIPTQIPTRAPIRAPTRVPIPAPTAAPTPRPTVAPISVGGTTVVPTPIGSPTPFLPVTLTPSGPQRLSPTPTVPNTPTQATLMPSRGHLFIPTQPPTQRPTQLPSQNRSPTSLPSIRRNPLTETPVLQSNEKTLSPSIKFAFSGEPTVETQSRFRVEGTSFFLEYNFVGRAATAREYAEASLATLSFLNEFMNDAFQYNRQIDYDGQNAEVLDVTTDPVTIAYSYGAYFVQSPDLRPIGQQDVDRLLSTAFSEPVNRNLVQRLSTNLNNTNPFSKTSMVVYRIDIRDRAQKELGEGFDVPSSAVALLIIGIFLGILGLGMILIRRRRFRQPVPTDDSYDLISSKQGSEETFGNDLAPVSNETRDEGSVWQWSVPSGHDGTNSQQKPVIDETSSEL